METEKTDKSIRQAESQETSLLFEKLREAVEIVAEQTADHFTMSKFMEFRGGKQCAFQEKFIVEGLIHQIRQLIRQEFKRIFYELCEKHNVRQLLMQATTEIERANILKQIQEVTGGLFMQGSDYYFEFMLNVLNKLKTTNKEVDYSYKQLQRHDDDKTPSSSLNY